MAVNYEKFDWSRSGQPNSSDQNQDKGAVSDAIFKAYDIRGIYPDELNEETAFKIGGAFAQFLDKQKELSGRQIVIARDARLSSPALFEAAAKGVILKSVNVIDIGEVSTPFFYWAVEKEQADGGIMITASHDPAQYNGLKLCGRKAKPISADSGLKIIQRLVNEMSPLSRRQSEFEPELLSLKKDEDFSFREKEDLTALSIPALFGKITKKDLLFDYIDFISQKEDLNKIKPLKIVIDCGNGVIGREIKEIAKKLSCQIDIIFGEPDGNFPNHEPNPAIIKNLELLRQKVVEQKADLGAAFDGDGDRLVLVDEQGAIIRGDFLGVLIAKELLNKNPGEKIFFEVRASQIVPETIKDNKGIPVLGRAGHSFIKEQMRVENILFGFETTGHYYFRELNFTDNAVFALLKVLLILSDSQKLLSELISPLNKYFLSGEINFRAQNSEKILDEIEKHFSDGQIKKIDGLTVEYPHWRFNLRQSNTEPLLRLNLEADTKELMEEKKEEIKKLIFPQ